jgi:fatty-acyl-CoA synthase
LARKGETHAGLLAGDDSWTWDEVLDESCVRSAVMASLLSDGEPPHVGVLLDNTPEFSLLLGGVALGGQAPSAPPGPASPEAPSTADPSGG